MLQELLGEWFKSGSAEILMLMSNIHISCVLSENYVFFCRYAAAYSAGLIPSGKDGALTREDIAQLVQLYLSNITQHVIGLGFPAEKLYTHLGGTMAAATCATPGNSSNCDENSEIPHIGFSAGNFLCLIRVHYI